MAQPISHLLGRQAELATQRRHRGALVQRIEGRSAQVTGDTRPRGMAAAELGEAMAEVHRNGVTL
jgi:hypothetical protein